MTLAVDDNDGEALEELIHSILYDVHTSMPGIVTRFGESDGVLFADVQPCIQQIDHMFEEKIMRTIPVIKNCVVAMPRSAGLGLSVTIPIQIGDEGMLHFAERSIDNWIDKGGVQPPLEIDEPRSHDLTDAVFVVGVINKPTPIANYSHDAIEVRDENGGKAISVSRARVQMRAGGESITMAGDGNITIIGNIMQTGEQTVSGDITSSATIQGSTVINDAGDSLAGLEAKKVNRR